MAKNYTFNASISVSASASSGFSQSQSGAFSLNLTNIDQVETGRKEITSSGDTLMSAPTYGKIVYVRNLDDTSNVRVYIGNATTDPIGTIEPGEWLFTILRDTELIRCDAETGTVTVEYFAVEIDSAA